jgi:hypothetical protein
MNKLAITIAALASALTLGAQSTQKLTAGKMNEYGLIYTLPTTAVNVTVEALRTVKTPGEFKLYSKKYLDIDPILEPSDTWSVKSVTLTTAGVSDNAESYLVQFKSGSTPYIIVDSNNCPLAVNDEEFTPATSPALPVAVEQQPSILQTPAAAQTMTAEMLQSQSTAKRAQLAAAKIYELRQSRNDIISGNADQMPADGEAMKLALDNLEKQEEALTAMFTGTVQTSTAVRTYPVVPGTSDSKVVAARVSATQGPVDTDDLSGMPVYLSCKVIAKGSLPTNEKGEEKKFPKGGLAYRIPGQASFTAIVNGNEMASLSADIAQLGIVFGIDPALFSDKKAPAYVIFNPATGAITEIGTK